MSTEKIGKSHYAFPFTFQKGIKDGVPEIVVDTGMELRDWFAGMALQGLLTCSKGGNGKVTFNGKLMPYDMAAYRIANAMLAARAKQ